MRLLAAIAAMIFATAPAALARRSASPPDSIAIETLGELPSQFKDRFITGIENARKGGVSLAELDPVLKFSPDGLHTAFILDKLSSVEVVLDAVPGKEYRSIWNATFSREGGHFAYFASPSAKGGPAVVLDGREFPVDEGIGSNIVLSPNGEHFAFVGVSRPGSSPSKYVVTDGGAGSLYESVSEPTISWDGRRVGYVAKRGYRQVVVIDGVEHREYPSADRPTFDLSGQHVSYTVGDFGKTYLFRDGEYSEVDPGARGLQFSRDGLHLAYVAPRANFQVLVVDGKESQMEGEILADTSLFSPDGNHTAYWAGHRDLWHLVVDGKAIWEQEEPPGPLHFTPDGEHVIHSQIRDSRIRVIADSTPDAEYDAVGVPRLGVNGRVAYVALRGDLWMVVVDGVEGPRFESVGNPTISPDGKHVAYTAWTAPNQACVIIDGQKGPTFDAVMPGGPSYRPEGRLEYLALRKSLLLRVRHVPR